MKKAKENPIEVDKTKLIIVLISILILCLLSFNVMNNMKEKSSQTKKVYICDELENPNSTLIKRNSDYVYISNRKYNYLDLKFQCELKKQTSLNSNYENVSINFSIK